MARAVRVDPREREIERVREAGFKLECAARGWFDVSRGTEGRDVVLLIRDLRFAGLPEGVGRQVAERVNEALLDLAERCHRLADEVLLAGGAPWYPEDHQ